MKAEKFFTVLGLIVFCIAAFLLYRALGQYNLEEILDSIVNVSMPRLAMAALFVACSYFTLTLFDALAVRYVGAGLPYRKIALASFSALSLGHTIGLAALSSGAIRYRFYSRWDISAPDIANIVLFCAVTVGLGLNTLGGILLLLQTDSAAQLLGLSRAAAVGVGAGCLALTAIYGALAALVRGRLRIKHWAISIPSLKLALAQTAVGTMNFAFVAAALHQILLSVSKIEYSVVAMVYVLGNVVGILTHVPGGLGVLEAVVVHLIPQAAVIGALVVFRALYFLLPFAIGAVAFGVCELAYRRRAGGAPPNPV